MRRGHSNVVKYSTSSLINHSFTPLSIKFTHSLILHGINPLRHVVITLTYSSYYRRKADAARSRLLLVGGVGNDLDAWVIRPLAVQISPLVVHTSDIVEVHFLVERVCQLFGVVATYFLVYVPVAIETEILTRLSPAPAPARTCFIT